MSRHMLNTVGCRVKKRETESGFPLSPLLFQILNVAANGLGKKKGGRARTVERGKGSGERGGKENDREIGKDRHSQKFQESKKRKPLCEIKKCKHA